MVGIYADLVMVGERSLDGSNGIKQVPVKYLNDVTIELEARGYFKETIKQ